MDRLSDYVCSTPFTYLEIHKNSTHSCCPTWLPNDLGDDINTVWGGEELNKIQTSVLDGSYRYCSKTSCPHLSGFISTGKVPSKFIKKDKFNLEDYIDGPKSLNFAFDRSCNLSCPTCRTSMIMANGSEIDFVESKLGEVVTHLGSSVELIYLSGTADPFASKTFRNFLLNIDLGKFPKLNHIHLHTNGQLLNNEMWGKLTHIHHLIKTIEISVDASTKETYEVVRRGGNWENIIENLKFISTIPMKNKNISFVVQDTNYTEMGDFYKMMMEIFNNNVSVFFNKIDNWGTYSDGEYRIKQIWSKSHPEFDKFLIELSKINKKYRCTHNMHDIIDLYLPKQINNLL
jgi:MoaA/NifB/PqqE/SkfB family radical SAM enzyme